MKTLWWWDGARNAQTSGRGADHAAGFAENAQDVIPLHLFQRGTAAGSRSVGELIAELQFSVEASGRILGDMPGKDTDTAEGS
jgi:hypothetical protein